ncbi:biopolymer transporter ExbD [Veillonella sp. oral taxon 780]|uniref:ExbD/TolR family protein n=1 Tax=Veillonella sp. oral taxon 780 TaxID=671229 RepID=UPI00021A2814|nr:biopolymer transporter ExbD [Veillonella sp. oral taxon 780]EGS33403.1 transport energizing protein, ExbD/TolR family [Veillonella sp. oral taxon 780 str. F0422]
MRLRSLRTTSKPKLMIIPMIDIIFFLLVFFMMSMLTMVVQKSVPIQLPQAVASKVDLQRKIPITVTSNGQIYVEAQPVTLDQMIRYLQAEKAKGDDMVVILRGDAKAEYGTFVTVLDTLKQMGIVKVSIATDSK